MKRRRCNRRLERKRAPVNWLAVLGVLVIADLVALTAWAVERLADPDTLPIREVRIEGEFRQIESAALRARVAGELRGGFYTARVGAIREALLRDPWVKEVVVRRVWPDSLEVTVYEQRAVAQWREQGLLNAEGLLFSPSRDSYPPGLVQLRGPEGTETQVLAKLRELERLLAGLEPGVSFLSLNSRGSWSFGLADGASATIGRTEFDKRVGRFVAIYTKILREEQPVHVDLRYANGFAVGPRIGGAGAPG